MFDIDVRLLEIIVKGVLFVEIDILEVILIDVFIVVRKVDVVVEIGLVVVVDFVDVVVVEEQELLKVPLIQISYKKLKLINYYIR
jgi:hypothetical protein